MRDVKVSTVRGPGRGPTGGVPSRNVSREDGAAGTAETPALIRGACILLMIVGAVTVLFGLPVMLNPTNARCHLARVWIDQANTDKKEWNNVDIGGRKARDLPCAEALERAKTIPLNEKHTKTARLPSESAVQNQNTIVVIMGLGQAGSGFAVVRSLSRLARNLAIGFSAAGIVLQVLELLSLGVFAFVVYAFAFSPVSREIWPKERHG